jgi:hypothetical protein
MKFLKSLATGQIPLWRAFWLIGTPLALLWDASGAGMVFGGGIQEPAIAGFIIAVFALSSLILPFVAVAIWRSASNYPREVWWHNVVAIGAKLGAVISGVAAALSVIGLLYLAIPIIYAVFALE